MVVFGIERPAGALRPVIRGSGHQVAARRHLRAPPRGQAAVAGVHKDTILHHRLGTAADLHGEIESAEHTIPQVSLRETVDEDRGRTPDAVFGSAVSSKAARTSSGIMSSAVFSARAFMYLRVDPARSGNNSSRFR